jgi:CDP-paratose 2-epimerase
MKALVTGGCGFLGSNIAAALLERGEEVVVVDALLRTGGEANKRWLEGQTKGRQLHFHHLDLADEAAVLGVFQKHGPFDFICHLGGQVAMTTSLADPRRDLRTNVLGSFNILEAARAHAPDALLAYSSTNKVYGDLRHLTYLEGPTRYTVEGFPQGFDETLPLDFASPYGCSKGAADQYMRDWFRNYGLRTVVFRHSSIYGGRQFSTFDQGWIGWFCQKALEQAQALRQGRAVEPFTIQGTGKQVRDVLHAQDLIALYLRAFECRGQVAGQIFNIGGGMDNSLSLLELFARLEQKLALPAPLQFRRLERRQSDQDFFVADVSLAGRLLGWSPRVSADEGLDRMLGWLKGVA